MIGRLGATVTDTVRLTHLSARVAIGRRYWIAPFLPLLWVGFQIFRLAVGWEETPYVAADAQTLLIGFPLTLLGIGFGVRIIAGEMDFRTLEIAYTVPGGAHRVWLAKLGAAFVLLVASEVLLAVATFLFCTGFSWHALYGALQAAVFYMVLAMAFSVLFKGEAVGALITCLVLVVNLPIQGGVPVISPFYNVATREALDPADLLAEIIRNRLGYALLIAAIAALAFGRAESREKILGG
jgi:ABC-type transport system involved in multi-copper enzyme maturation permease subunit